MEGGREGGEGVSGDVSVEVEAVSNRRIGRKRK